MGELQKLKGGADKGWNEAEQKEILDSVIPEGLCSCYRQNLVAAQGGPICVVDFAHPGRRINGGVGKPVETMNGWENRRELPELF